MSGSNLVNANLDKWVTQRLAGVMGACTLMAAEFAAEAKVEAPWQPIYKPPKPSKITGDARKGLYGKAKREGTEFTIELGHRVNYGVYLELANDGKFGILEKKLNSRRLVVYNRVKQIMRSKF